MKHLEIAEPVLREIAQRLVEISGIDPDSLDTRRMGWTIERRRRQLSVPDPQAYLEQLKCSSDELEHLMDALVIQETRFFRDHAVFEQIGIWAQNQAANSKGSLRVLSAPCSTGQEAYSVAAILRRAGIPLSNFEVDAFDISRTALATAQRGIYPKAALLHVSIDLQCSCGELQNDQWRIHDDLRRRIQFERRNLAVAGALGDEPVYDLILCRNLLIYLHANTRAVLAESLCRALRPGGRLIIGTGDRVPELNSRFAPLKPAAGFSFIHKVAAPPTNQSGIPTLAFEALASRRLETRSRPAPQPQTALDRVAPVAAEFYRRAIEYSERGNMRQAERRCRQALYLAPGYLPALELLQSLWQLHPSARLRRALQERICRLRRSHEPAVGVARKEFL